MEPRALVETHLEMLNTHDADLVDRFVAEDYVNHDVVTDGRQADRGFWTTLFEGLPDLTATVEDVIVAGDRVVGRFAYRGTHRGALTGIPATGAQVEMRSIDIWRVQDGLLVEHWDELNLMEVFQQVDVLPPLGGAEDGRP